MLLVTKPSILRLVNEDTRAKLEEKIAANENIVATGYSCHSQVKRFDDKDIMHPIEVLFESL